MRAAGLSFASFSRAVCSCFITSFPFSTAAFPVRGGLEDASLASFTEDVPEVLLDLERECVGESELEGACENSQEEEPPLPFGVFAGSIALASVERITARKSKTPSVVNFITDKYGASGGERKQIRERPQPDRSRIFSDVKVLLKNEAQHQPVKHDSKCPKEWIPGEKKVHRSIVICSRNKYEELARHEISRSISTT